jgi:hypothetical protein
MMVSLILECSVFSPTIAVHRVLTRTGLLHVSTDRFCTWADCTLQVRSLWRQAVGDGFCQHWVYKGTLHNVGLANLQGRVHVSAAVATTAGLEMYWR